MMRAPATAVFTACLSLGLCSCGGDKEQDESGSLDESEYTAGDGIGSFGLSLEQQVAEDLKRYIAEGADPTKSYIIEHHLAADNLQTAREIVAWGKENGFTPVFDESKVVEGEWIYVDLHKESKLEVAPLWSDSKGVTLLAQRLMCEYDGWGFSDTP